MAAEQNIQHACFHTFLCQKKEVKEHKMPFTVCLLLKCGADKSNHF